MPPRGFALLAALAWRERSGRGQRIVVSQIESTLAACPDAVMDAAAHGAEAPPGAYFAHHAGPTGIYRCAGVDRWVAVDVVDAAQQARLAEVLGGKPPSSLAAWLAQHSPEDAVARLRAAGLAAAAVADPADLLRDAQLSARGFWQRVAHPVIGDALYHGIAARLSLTPAAYRTGAPLLGEHDAELPALLDSCRG